MINLKTDTSHVWKLIGVSANVTFSRLSSWQFVLGRVTHEVSDTPAINIHNSSFGSIDLQPKTKALVTHCFIDARLKSGPTLISANNATVSVTNCHFSRFKSKSGPTVMLEMNNSQISVTNTSIVKNHGLFGTLFIVDGSSITFTSVFIADNVADEFGFSSVMLWNGVFATICNSHIANNRAVFGGAMWASNYTHMEVTNTTFLMNEARQGGAIMLQNNTRLVLRNSKFSFNQAKWGKRRRDLSVNSMIAPPSLQMYLKQSRYQFRLSEDFGSGGAIVGRTKSEIVIDNSTFVENSAETSGGGLVLARAKTVIMNSTFLRNWATNLGGVLLLHDQDRTGHYNYPVKKMKNQTSGFIGKWSTLDVQDSIFKENMAREGGCVLGYGNVTVNIENSTFLLNKGGEGGAINMHHGKTLQTRNIHVSSSLFSNNTAVKGGAIVLHHYINASIENCTFLQNSGFHGAAVNAFMNVTVQVDLCVFSQNKGKGRAITLPDSMEELVPDGGTFVTHEHSRLYVSKSVFMNNTSELGTGTITLYRHVTAVVAHCTFHDNVARWGGALFAMSDVNIYLTGAIFNKNLAILIGGALDVGPNVFVDVNATTFSDNHAFRGAGVNIQKKCTFRLSDCIFTRQNSSTFGGALALHNNASGNISNCLFDGNTASIKGGGIFISLKSNCVISNGTFKSNTADFGGALYVKSEVKLTVGYSDFMNNHAELHGGSIFGTDFVQIYLQNSTFYNNSAMDGGALLVKDYGVLNVTNSNFTGNHASMNAGALLLVTNVNGTFLSSHFGQNLAQFGGVFVLSDNTNVEIKESNMTLNVAEFEGGVILGFISTQLSMDRCQLTGNSARIGGALAVKSCKVIISNSKLIKNEAHLYGGVLYLRDFASCTISYSQLLKNKAKIGGAIYSTNNVTLIGSDINFKRNTAHSHGSSIFGETNVSIILNQTTFNGNSAKYGNIHISDGCRFNITNGIFINNEGTVIVLANVSSSIDRSLFQKNFSPDNNSKTIFVTNGGHLQMNNTLFRQNQAGVLTAVGSERLFIHIENCRFWKNLIDSDIREYIFQIIAARYSSFLLSNSEVVGSTGNTILLNGNITTQFFNCTFTNNKGRVLTFSDFSQGKMKYCLFSENTASYGAAVSAQNVRTISVIHCKFYNNSAESLGAALHIQKSAMVELTSCTFKGNEATLSGGAVYMEEIEDSKISNSDFTDNNASTSGGAVSLDHVTGTITNCTFFKNQARYGGACSITTFVKLDILNCRFEDNYAHRGGGAAEISSNASLNIFKTIFFRNRAKDSGGALALFDDMTGNIFHCDFVENIATSFGAVAAYDKTTLVFYQCEFKENVAQHSSGAVGALSDSTLNISMSRFFRNKADGTGGAVLVWDQVNCIVSESNFVRNSAELGGAIGAVTRVKLTINKCLFIENNAKIGGALAIEIDSDVHVHVTIWVGNVASNGGAMFLKENVRCTVERSEIERNKVHELGGAVCAIDTTVNFIETKFTSNGAKYGGAYYSDSSKTAITGCVFSTNFANHGGVFTSHSGNIQVYNSSFSTNSAKRGGVGLVTNHSFLKIEGSTLETNTADEEVGALFLTKTVTAEISNTTFFNNSATLIGVAYITIGTKVHLKNVTFDGNYETGVAWLWVLAYIKPYLSQTIGHYFHGIIGTSGVMTVDSLSYLVADGCLFIDNSARYAGVLLVHNSSVRVKDSEFIENNARFVGVFEAAYDVQMEFSNTTFKGNQARLADIGRIMANSNVNITNITVHGKTRNRLHFLNMDIAHKSSLRLENSSLSNIIGAYYMFRVWDSSHVFLNEVLMENNFLYGISHISRGSTLTMVTCNITDNKIENSIITLEDHSAANIQNTSIKDNVLLVSLKGGSLFHVTQNSTLMATQSKFTENFAAKGELILVQNNSSFVLDNCTFENNSAEYGVLLCKSTDFIVFNETSFVRNEAFVSGGVTFTENCGIQVVNSRMAGNKAQHYGGCVVSVDGILEVS